MRFIALLFFAIIPKISAQEDSTAEHFFDGKQAFLSLGLGSGTYGSHIEYALQYITNSHTFSVRYLECYQFTDATDQCPASNASEFAILYGYTKLFTYKRFMSNMIQVHAGVSIVEETNVTFTKSIIPVGFCDPSTEATTYPVGLAYSIQAIQTILPAVGIGINLYGSFNTGTPIRGLSFMMYFGKLY